MKQEKGLPNNLLSHIPLIKPEDLSKYNIFLFLAGHTHGEKFFPFQTLDYYSFDGFSGLNSDKNKNHYIYVSQGLNNTSDPMRVWSSRILAFITIEVKK